PPPAPGSAGALLSRAGPVPRPNAPVKMPEPAPRLPSAAIPVPPPPPASPSGTRATDANSPIAALVAEAVSNIEELPPSPLKAETTRRPLSYSPARMAESEQISARLRAIPLFAELPHDRLRELGRQAGMVRFNAEDPLCEAGGPEGPLFVILEGA